MIRIATIILILFTVLLSACGSTSSGRSQKADNPQDVSAPIVARGLLEYQAKCDNCHGEDGRGIGSNPSLAVSWDLTQLSNSIINHVTPLPAPCDDTCATEVANYIIDTFVPNTVYANRGKADYDALCAFCHGASGEGGSGGALTPDVCRSCSNLEELIDRIDLTMPPQDITLCDRSVATNFCAEETAKYILAGFIELNESGTPNTPGNPNNPGVNPPVNCPVTQPPNNSGNGIPNQGRSLYTEQCALCHGDQGQGSNLGGPLNSVDDCPNCVDISTLTQYIDQFMPTADVTQCTVGAETGACANETAAYILSGFQEVADTSSSPPVTQDNCPTTPGSGGGRCEHWSVLFSNIYESVLLADCAQCHATGLLQSTPQVDFKLYNDFSLDIVSFYEMTVLIHERSGLPLILAKPTFQTPHGGLRRFAVNSNAFNVMKAVTDRLLNPNQCP